MPVCNQLFGSAVILPCSQSLPQQNVLAPQVSIWYTGELTIEVFLYMLSLCRFLGRDGIDVFRRRVVHTTRCAVDHDKLLADMYLQYEQNKKKNLSICSQVRVLKSCMGEDTDVIRIQEFGHHHTCVSVAVCQMASSKVSSAKWFWCKPTWVQSAFKVFNQIILMPRSTVKGFSLVSKWYLLRTVCLLFLLCQKVWKVLTCSLFLDLRSLFMSRKEVSFYQ